MTWRSVALEDIAIDMQPGFACQPTSDGGGVAQLRTNNVSAEGRIDLSEVKRVPATATQMHRYLLTPGDILFNNTNSPALVGKTAFFDEPGEYVFSNHMTRIRLNRALAEPRYVGRFLHWAWAQGAFRSRVTQWVNQAAINRSQLASVMVPLPPLSEQRRIVEILDQADRLRHLRTEADAKADRILPALFIKMFGDPATNPKGWPRKRLGELLNRIDSGWSPVCENRQAAPDEWGVLKLGAVTTNRYIESENKALPTALDPRPELEVQPGDFLFTRKNTRELVGACAYVERTRPRLLLSDLVFRLRLKANAEMHPLYLWALMTSPSKRSSIEMLAGGSAGSMPNISKGRLEALEIEKPPHVLQTGFSGTAADVDSLTRKARVARASIERSFAVLLHRAFTGELTAKWREAHMTELLQEMEHQAKALQEVQMTGTEID
ncbi:MAG: restriction endonuclease subunit S [bacterium]